MKVKCSWWLCQSFCVFALSSANLQCKDKKNRFNGICFMRVIYNDKPANLFPQYYVVKGIKSWWIKLGSVFSDWLKLFQCSGKRKHCAAGSDINSMYQFWQIHLRIWKNPCKNLQTSNAVGSGGIVLQAPTLTDSRVAIDAKISAIGATLKTI